ncbi:ABC transporter permease subunit [Actinocorallia sp. B10E7]|uniref:ABC transporter permease subunit n=1 Tax=Actinocorallia sp. B10E7 TaxID=3153558 RepID=UPI00325D5656
MNAVHHLPGTSAAARAFSGSMFGKTLWDNRRVFTVWAAATGLLTALYASMYPQVSSRPAAEMPEAMEGFGLNDTVTAAGYLQGAVFGLLVPLMVVFYGSATGARMISADEESGYLDLLLAHPISRTRLLLHRFAALAAGAAAICLTVLLVLLALRSSADLGSVTVTAFLAQATGLFLLSVLFGALALAVSAATAWGRAAVFGTTAALGVLAYAVRGFAPSLDADWLKYATPFHYYIGGEPLRNSFQYPDLAVLAAATALLLALAVRLLNRRDLGR